jgi:hypothetical protein
MRRISSLFTPVVAVALVLMFPVTSSISLVGLLLKPAAAFSRTDPAFTALSVVIVLAYSVFGTFLTYMFLMRVLTIKLDGNVMHVTRFGRSVSIPLSHVSTIASTFFFVPDFVWMRIDPPAKFGATVAFMPRLRLVGVFGRHPIVEELEQLVAQAKRLAV